MAELSDWSNRQILILEKSGSSSKATTGVFRVVFQDWKWVDEFAEIEEPEESGVIVYADITCLGFQFDPSKVQDFFVKAREYLQLPIKELSHRHFSGVWEFGDLKNHSLTITISPYPRTPTKTDWMNAYLELEARGLSWSGNFHIDQSCLSIFADGLLREFSADSRK